MAVVLTAHALPTRSSQLAFLQQPVPCLRPEGQALGVVLVLPVDL